MALTALTVVLTPRLDDLALVAIAGLISVGALMAVRNVPLALVAAAPVLARHWGLLWRYGIGWSSIQPVQEPTESLPLSALAQTIMGALALLVLVETGLFRAQIPAAKQYPEGAVAFMAAHRLHGNILNYFAWGQYLIWHCSANSKIFIDGRYDLVYPPDVVRQYMDFYAAKPRAGFVLDHYPHDFVLMPPAGPVSRFMQSRADWKLVYHDGTAELYARAGTFVSAGATEAAHPIAATTQFP